MNCIKTSALLILLTSGAFGQNPVTPKFEPQFTFANTTLANTTTNSDGVDQLSYMKRGMQKDWHKLTSIGRSLTTATHSNGQETQEVRYFILSVEPNTARYANSEPNKKSGSARKVRFIRRFVNT